jgi:GAF domain-containing protein
VRTVPAGPDIVTSPDRLAVLDLTGLGSEPDIVLDGYCSAVQQALSAPVALVSLVRADRQEFPGQAGLEPVLGAARESPLTHSFCQYVVRRSSVVVVTDTAESPRLADTGRIVSELGIGSYAGVPLTDGDGHVLGALCVLDRVARDWSGEELRTLRTYADVVSAELRRRINVRRHGGAGPR